MVILFSVTVLNPPILSSTLNGIKTEVGKPDKLRIEPSLSAADIEYVPGVPVNVIDVKSPEDKLLSPLMYIIGVVAVETTKVFDDNVAEQQLDDDVKVKDPTEPAVKLNDFVCPNAVKFNVLLEKPTNGADDVIVTAPIH